MSQIHFGYVLFDEGTDNESVRVLLAASLAGLEAQAHLLGLILRMEDYVNEYYDLESHDEESLYEVEHKKCSDSKCIVAGAEYPCVEEAKFITVSATVTTEFWNDVANGDESINEVDWAIIDLDEVVE